MPRMCCREQHHPSRGQSSSAHHIQGEVALKSTSVRSRTHRSPVLLEAPSCPAWDSGDQLGSCWGQSPSAPFLKGGRSSPGMGDKQHPALRGAGRSCSQPEDEEGSVQAADPSPGGKAAAWRRRPKTRHAKAGERPQALPFAFPQGALSLLHLGSATGRGVDGIPAAPMGAATQCGHPNPSARGTFAIPSSSLHIISHFFPYHHPRQHRCHHLPARSSRSSPAPSVGS